MEKIDTLAEIEIKPEGITLNGRPLDTEGQGADILVNAYRRYVGDYPKFFKMDGLCRLGFLASELLLQSIDEERFVAREDRAVILFNHSGSVEVDRRYQETISKKEDFFPSPALFVYTLPNIVTGEIAIRNQYLGETSFLCLDHREDKTIDAIVETAFSDDSTKSVLTGWVDYSTGSDFEAYMKIVRSSY